MAAQRAIIIDDTDSRIQYSGSGWSPTKGGQDNLGNFGAPYKDTLHGTNVDGSLSFSFTGTKVTVFGTNNLRNDSGVLDPTWECFIDNNSIGNTPAFQFPENNWIFCEADGLSDGPHILTVNASVKKGQTFWFDDIQYVPSSSVSLDNTEIVVNNQDSAIQYGNGWVSLGNNANATQNTNSIFTFNFVGVSLSWYSFIPTEYPHGASLASYSVDGQASTQFSIGPAQGSTTVYNQILFETPQYSMGPHQIVVTYHGSSSTTPLALDFMIVQNGTSPVSGTPAPAPSHSPSSPFSSSSSSSTSTSSSSSFSSSFPQFPSSPTIASLSFTTATSSSPSSSVSLTSSGDTNSAGSRFSSNVGAITGGVVGGIVLIIMAILAVIYFRRWDRKQRSTALYNHTGQESGNAVDPFQLTPSLWSSPASYSQYTSVPNNMGDSRQHQPIPNQSTSDINFAVPPSSTSSRKNLLAGSSHDDTPTPYSSTPTNDSHVGNNSSMQGEMSSKAMREIEAVAAVRLQPLRHSAHPTIYTVAESVPPMYSAE
ncbi:hypothetical protein JR316_0006755 [Psilocybe cubensis]|uniref:Uncharacterized protein n=2 Tax=Psilocybe cubensis TaxID=181762 RepID=A0A8H7XL19_PSICU|nr:hypothetical protein JR316_0006755 [Psilocybe cubensis]KAH9480158.1 hypothetical protein JR316_0006755 [Psilocybe cubensis]